MRNRKIFSFDAETDGLWGDPFCIAAIVYELQSGPAKLFQRTFTPIMEGTPFFIRDVPADEVVTLEKELSSLSNTPLFVKKETPDVWVEVDRIILRLPDSVVTSQWVIDNVLPTLKDVPVTKKVIDQSRDGWATKSGTLSKLQELSISYGDMLQLFADFYLKHKDNADIIAHVAFPVEVHLLREMHRLGFIGDWDGPFPLRDVSGYLHCAGENLMSCDEYVAKHKLAINVDGSVHNPLYDCEVAARVYMDLVKRFKI